MATNPTLLTQPIAANGAKNAIPNTTTTPGKMSQDQGFPTETSLPLGAGGVAPSREDFNGAFNLLSGLAFYNQKGFTYNYDASQDYYTGCIVIDSADGLRYECIADMAAGTIAPHDDTTNTYWQIFKSGLDKEAIPAVNHRDVITTSGTYTAPVTGWYHITCIGGGGAGGNGGHNYTYGGLSGTQGGTSSFGVYCSAVGGHSGAGGGSYAEGGGGAAGEIAHAYVQLTQGDTVPVTVGAGGAAPTSGYSSNATGANGSGGAVGGSTFAGGEGAASVWGSGRTGVGYLNPVSAVYGSLYPRARGGSNGTNYGGGGAGSTANYTSHVGVGSICGDSEISESNGERGAIITQSAVTYPKGGDGGDGAVIVEYFV